MDVDAMLCDHAEVAEGKLFINGAAINLLWVAPQPPHVISMAVATVIQVPYTATNQAHKVTVKVMDEDGNGVVPWSPDGAPPPPPVHIEGDFNVGRPAGIPAGEVQAIPFAFGLQGLPMPELGLYSVSIEIDGTEVRRLPFRVLVQNQTGAF